MRQHLGRKSLRLSPNVVSTPNKTLSAKKEASVMTGSVYTVDSIAANIFIRTCTSSIYTSTYTQLEKEFDISRIVATLGLSLFIMGLGIGPMLLGPLS
jgi:hypothetical protein